MIINKKKIGRNKPTLSDCLLFPHLRPRPAAAAATIMAAPVSAQNFEYPYYLGCFSADEKWVERSS